MFLYTLLFFLVATGFGIKLYWLLVFPMEGNWIFQGIYLCGLIGMMSCMVFFGFLMFMTLYLQFALSIPQ